MPNIRSRSSKPKLWVHMPTESTSAPKNIFNFIEQRLLLTVNLSSAHLKLTVADWRTKQLGASQKPIRGMTTFARANAV